MIKWAKSQAPMCDRMIWYTYYHSKSANGAPRRGVSLSIRLYDLANKALPSSVTKDTVLSSTYTYGRCLSHCDWLDKEFDRSTSKIMCGCIRSVMQRLKTVDQNIMIQMRPIRVANNLNFLIRHVKAVTIIIWTWLIYWTLYHTANDSRCLALIIVCFYNLIRWSTFCVPPPNRGNPKTMCCISSGFIMDLN